MAQTPPEDVRRRLLSAFHQRADLEVLDIATDSYVPASSADSWLRFAVFAATGRLVRLTLAYGADDITASVEVVPPLPARVQARYTESEQEFTLASGVFTLPRVAPGVATIVVTPLDGMTAPFRTAWMRI